jgi:hypothetical protein
MIKAKITKLDDVSIRIEQRFDNGTSSNKCHAAQFCATGNESLNTVTVSTDKTSFCSITAAPAELEINGHVPASVEEAVTLLNAFIGNFNMAGGSALTTLQEMETALTWD